MSCHNFNYGFTIVNTYKIKFDICIKIFFLKKTYTFVIQLFKNVKEFSYC